MDFNKLTTKSQSALAAAQDLAAARSHQQVDVEHLLLALLQDAEGLIPRMLRRMEVDPKVLEKLVSDEVARSRCSGQYHLRY